MGASGNRTRLANPIETPTSHAPGMARRLGARPSLTRVPRAGTKLPQVIPPFLATSLQPWEGCNTRKETARPATKRRVRAARRPFRAPESATD